MKSLVIKHDGKFTVSGFGVLNLGNQSLNSLISNALGLEAGDYNEYIAEVLVDIKLKSNEPDVTWEDDEC